MTTATMQVDGLTPILQKREEEIKTLQGRIAAVQQELNAMKPVVEDYNAKAKWRKDLRRELAHKQREVQIVAKFFGGMSLFDERFPLFAAAAQERNNGSQTTTEGEHDGGKSVS